MILKRSKKAVGILESSILIALVSSAMVAMRGYVEKNIKASTKNYTDAILGVERKKPGQEFQPIPEPTPQGNVFYRLNPMQASTTRVTESSMYSGKTGTATREYAKMSASTPVTTSKDTETKTYIDIIPAKRGFITPVRIWNVIPDDDQGYDATLFGTP